MAGAPVITGFCNLITLLKIKQILVWPGSAGRACRVFCNPNSEPGENSRLLGLEPSENLHKFRRLNTQSIYAKLFCLLSRYFWLPKSAPWSQGKNLFNPIRAVTWAEERNLEDMKVSTGMSSGAHLTFYLGSAASLDSSCLRQLLCENASSGHDHVAGVSLIIMLLLLLGY